MLTCRFHGQLGNNLFQLATLLSYKERKKNIFLLDYTHRGNIEEIENFFVHPKNLEIQQMFKYRFNFLNLEIFHQNYSKDFNLHNHPDFTHNGFFGFTELPDEEYIMLNGYFQSEKYFNFFAEKLRDVYFEPSDEIKNEIKEKYSQKDFINSLSIHYRRGGDRHIGDMQDYFRDLDFSYYQDSISEICENKQIDRIFVFSDDVPWCEENKEKLIPESFEKDVVFVTGNKNYVDLFLMSMCENNIVANSTFSWWSAWLNKNPDKYVIAPKKNWFGPKLRHMYLDDLFPSSWITK